MADHPIVSSVAVHLDLDPYLSLEALESYSGFDISTLKRFMRLRTNPLPYFQPTPNGKKVVRKSEWDTWILRHRKEGVTTNGRDVSGLVNRAMAAFQA